ncbi:MAG: hypothetical protein ACK4OE_15470 [Acidovorax sp.]|uniref:hypothetical protein n=1 Tax=Acidovorax sp. TaxID=1872122 RepID=UPI003919FF05
MSISIVVDNKVKFRVKGSFRNGEGVDQPFDFGLRCKRLDTDAITDLKSSDGSYIYADFMAAVIEEWFDVNGGGADGKKAVPYTTDAWHALCKTPGVAALAWATYMRENGAKEKN